MSMFRFFVNGFERIDEGTIWMQICRLWHYFVDIKTTCGSVDRLWRWRFLVQSTQPTHWAIFPNLSLSRASQVRDCLSLAVISTPYEPFIENQKGGGQKRRNRNGEREVLNVFLNHNFKTTAIFLLKIVSLSILQKLLVFQSAVSSSTWTENVTRALHVLPYYEKWKNFPNEVI